MNVLSPVCETHGYAWLLAFDFDGTLVIPDEDPPVHPQFFEIIRRMRASHKVLWGINTGRSLMQTVQGIGEARFPFLPDYIIAREREIYTPNDFGRWVGLSDWNKRCDNEHGKLFRKCRRLLKCIRKWVEQETGAIWGMQDGEPAGIVASTATEMDYIVKKLDQDLQDTPMLCYQRNGIYLRFSHRDFHKGSAMAEVARRSDLDADRTFAIGDSHNDLDMLDLTLAARIACPHNACEEVKSRVLSSGGYVARGVASVGAIEALRSAFSLED
ncbi:MAG: HAD hydrolase family protein [Verrucomicrobiae bacterium]|nr:HAD hydrolase family protein [Verrucomicrobiae bacterium]NNJ41885.1 HAD family phosphatase [Akkermansiaceae bacterium]